MRNVDAARTQPSEDPRIRVEHPHELEHWARQLGCSEDELEEAIRAVGSNVADVRAHFEAMLGIPM